MENELLKSIVVIFGLSIVVLLVFHRLRIPTIVGFLITGILCGPKGTGLISNVDEVRTLAELGIVLLLFVVGLEFSLRSIFEFKRYFVIAGPLQVGLTTIAGFVIAALLGRPNGEAIFLGFLLSLSSTAIVMRVLQERAESTTTHGRLTTGILIFQDIIVVPMMLLTPLLAGNGGALELSLIWLLLEGMLILFVIFFGALKLVPFLLYHVARTRNRELFLLSVLVICFSVAWATSSIGLSLALGAFLAGLIISESEYGHQAMGNVLPFQDIFTSFFFVSIGMLIDLDFFIQNPGVILLTTVGVILLKSSIVMLTAFLVKVPIRPSVLTSLGLAQVGEFSFVLATTGFAYGIGTDYLHQVFLAVAVLSMGATPIFIAGSPKFAHYLQGIPWVNRLFSEIKEEEKVDREELFDHVVIAGFGFSGKQLSRSAKDANIPYVILEINPEIVLREKMKGEPIYFGDATSERVLHHVHADRAQVVVILVDDWAASLRIVECVRLINPSACIIVRTRYLKEAESLFKLGADEVVADEVGSTIDLFGRVLTKYGVSDGYINQLASLVRSKELL